MSHKGPIGTKGERGLRVGFVASCFDLLHAGHCLMLKDAKDQCDWLVAALHTDPSKERFHKNTPIQSLEERLIQLQSIKYIDQIFTYESERDLMDLLRKVRPQVRILGSDHMGENFTGKNLDIPIFYHIRTHEWSTSELRDRIKNA